MTLTNFKYALKIAVFVVVVLVYTSLVFVAGRESYGITAKFVESKIEDQTNAQSKVESPQGQDTEQSSRVLASYVKLCSNTALGFEVAYPKDWFTTFNDPQDQCLYFAPYSFVLPQTAGDDVTPITIKLVKPDEWENTLKLYQNPNELFGVLNSNNVEINGQAATIVESRSTGVGSVPKGFIRTVYLIFDSEKPVVIAYNQLDNQEDVVANQKFLEDLVSSLKLF